MSHSLKGSRLVARAVSVGFAVGRLARGQVCLLSAGDFPVSIFQSVFHIGIHSSNIIAI
jgi:hypothetical protein